MINKSAITRNITEYELPKVSPHWPSKGKYLGFIVDKSAGHFHNGYDFIELGNKKISLKIIEDNLIDNEFSFIPTERIL